MALDLHKVLSQLGHRVRGMLSPAPSAPPEPPADTPPQPVSEAERERQVSVMRDALTRMVHIEWLQRAVGGIYSISDVRHILGAFKGFGGSEKRLQPKLKSTESLRQSDSAGRPEPLEVTERRLSQGFTPGRLNFSEPSASLHCPEVRPPELGIVIERKFVKVATQLSAQQFLRPVRLAWAERGFEVPGIQYADDMRMPSGHLSLRVRGVEHATADVPTDRVHFHDGAWKPAPTGHMSAELITVLQLESARLVTHCLSTLVGRDFIRLQARRGHSSIEPCHYRTLSLVAAEMLQAGLTAPTPSEWSEILIDPPTFDQLLLNRPEVPVREALSLEERLQNLILAVPEDLRSYFRRELGSLGGSLSGSAPHPSADPYRLTLAIDEFMQAARGPDDGLALQTLCHSHTKRDPWGAALRVLRAWFLRDPEREFRERCQQNPQAMVRYLAKYAGRPAQSLPVFVRIGVLTDIVAPGPSPFRSCLETFLGRLPRYQPDPYWQGRVLGDYARLFPTR